jgi:hypothetical protein
MGHVPCPILVVTTRTIVELVGTEGNYWSSARVGLLSLYLTRISCNLVPPYYIRVGKDPKKISSSKVVQTTTQDVGYYAYCSLNLSKVSCFLHLRISYLSDTPTTIYHLEDIPWWAWRLNTDRQAGPG